MKDNFEVADFQNIDIQKFPELEQFMFHRMYLMNENFKKYFKNYDFHNLYKELLNFCTVDLSAFYFDIRKDCLYCDSSQSEKRKSVIRFLHIILDSLLKWFAPILSFTTEEIFRLIYNNKKSVHLEKFVQFPEKIKNDKLNKKWIQLIKIRDVCNLSIEQKRAEKVIGSSLEASINIKLDKKNLEIVKDIDFSELCITSAANIELIDNSNLEVITKKAEGNKCSVCWKIKPESCDRHGCGLTDVK